jgi:hypothetical protein
VFAVTLEQIVEHLVAHRRFVLLVPPENHDVVRGQPDTLGVDTVVRDAKGGLPPHPPEVAALARTLLGRAPPRRVGFQHGRGPPIGDLES